MKVELSDSNFEYEVVKSDIPVMVHFTHGSAYDSKVEAVIEELYPEYSDKLKFGSLNISENISTAERYGVSMSPNLLMFKNGKAVTQIRGVVPKQIIAGNICKLITTPSKELPELRLRPNTKPSNGWFARSLNSLIALDAKLGGKSDQWSDAFLSGLIAGIVMAIARNKLGGGIGFLVAAFVYGFLILRISFTVLQRLFATALMLAIGFYWREILEWLRGALR